MRTDDNYGSTIAYEPNSYDEWHDTPSRKEPPMKLQGGMFNYDERQYDDYYYTQPGKLWQLMSADDKKATCDNTAAQMRVSRSLSSNVMYAHTTLPTKNTGRCLPKR